MRCIAIDDDGKHMKQLPHFSIADLHLFCWQSFKRMQASYRMVRNRCPMHSHFRAAETTCILRLHDDNRTQDVAVKLFDWEKVNVLIMLSDKFHKSSTIRHVDITQCP